MDIYNDVRQSVDHRTLILVKKNKAKRKKRKEDGCNLMFAFWEILTVTHNMTANTTMASLRKNKALS